MSDCLTNTAGSKWWRPPLKGLSKSPLALTTPCFLPTPALFRLASGQGFPGGSEVKASACNAGDLGSIPGSGRSLGGGHGNPFQYSCLENLHRQRNLAGYSPWGCTESDTTEQLHFHFTFTSPDTSTTEHHFHFGPDASFFLELLVVALHSFPEVYWTPSSLRGSSGFIYFSLFVVFMGFLR